MNDQCDKLAVDRKEEEEMEMRKGGRKKRTRTGREWGDWEGKLRACKNRSEDGESK